MSLKAAVNHEGEREVWLHPHSEAEFEFCKFKERVLGPPPREPIEWDENSPPSEASQRWYKERARWQALEAIATISKRRFSFSGWSSGETQNFMPKISRIRLEV